MGFGELPVCMAKNTVFVFGQHAASGRAAEFLRHRARPEGQRGAGFIVVYTGDILTMPGPPKAPAAERIDIDETGKISGLF
ncbi:MAG: formate--tetrahydrofolate ligase [Eubacteriales bacterium]